jgi:hypothetical protein
MKQQQIQDLYADYLLASFGATTATGLSQLLDGAVSHDQVTRHLSGKQKTAADLWLTVKPFVRQVQSEAGVLIIDDSIEEKPYTDENDLVCWHYDHAKAALVKGSNFMTAWYASQAIRLPGGFPLIAKTETDLEQNTQKEKRRSPVSKNAYCRGLIQQAGDNPLPLRFVGFDTWCASAENRRFIQHEPQRDFLCPWKTNRQVAVRVAEKHQGRYTRVDTLLREEHAPRAVYLAGVDCPLLLAKPVCTNEDGSIGILSLVSSDPTISFDDCPTHYHKRWQVACYHTSLKQNVSLEKSPTHTPTTPTNHCFAALCGFIKLERLKVDTKLNHFALKSTLYINALHSAFSTLRALTPVQFTA